MKYTVLKLKIDPEIAELWASALESGEYKQGEGFLHTKEKNGDSFCCLGVLCDLAVKHGVIPEPVIDDEGTYKYGKRRTSSESLPPSVQRWAHTPADPEIVRRTDTYGKHSIPFSILNDVHRFTFKKIAKLIREGAGIK